MQKNKKKKPVEFDKMWSAIEGDPDSINQVLLYFQPYINSRCKRKLIDEFGRVHYVVDEYMKRRLETKLISKIMDFEIRL